MDELGRPVGKEKKDKQNHPVRLRNIFAKEEQKYRPNQEKMKRKRKCRKLTEQSITKTEADQLYILYMFWTFQLARSLCLNDWSSIARRRKSKLFWLDDGRPVFHTIIWFIILNFKLNTGRPFAQESRIWLYILLDCYSFEEALYFWPKRGATVCFFFPSSLRSVPAVPSRNLFSQLLKIMIYALRFYSVLHTALPFLDLFRSLIRAWIIYIIIPLQTGRTTTKRFFLTSLSRAAFYIIALFFVFPQYSFVIQYSYFYLVFLWGSTITLDRRLYNLSTDQNLRGIET